jgi:zinc/manganese transport system substrate-binding protein
MILICPIAVVVVALSGCGEDDPEGTQVLATTEIAADIARAVAGPDAEVETLLPEGASPHDYAASARDRARIDDADLVVAWGPRLEAGSVGVGDHARFELAAGEEDPHVWMDPTRIEVQLDDLAEEMAREDPAGAAGYRERAAAYAKRLTRLDMELRRTLAAVPRPRRRLVTSHDSLGHFAERYRFEFVGAPFGVTPEAAASAETVAELIERIESEDVPAVFAEDTDDPELMEEIAREAGVEVVDDLLVEGFGGEVESYEDMLRHDARRIAEALAP